MDNSVKCSICGGDACAESDQMNGTAFFECKVCGKFRKYMMYEYNNKDFLASFLYYKCKISLPVTDKKYYFLCPDENILSPEDKPEQIQKKYPHARLVSIQDVEAWYPRTFSEKIDTILLGFSKLSKYDGNSFEMTYEQCCSAFFVKRYNSGNLETTNEERENQIKFIENYLLKNNFIEINKYNPEKILITLLPDGFRRIDELQKNQSLNSKNVFVAMSFAADMKEAREAIRKAILETGYIPRIVDEVEHNNQIVPEMLYEIKQSKFVIAELTTNNNGAYYEAGYAAGLGKEVIHVCKKDSFDKGIHFDVEQVNTIVWETGAELTEKLSKRIKATIE